MSEKFEGRGHSQTIPEEPGVTVIGIRHADKNTGVTDSVENPQALTEQGKENARKEAEIFFEQVKQAPAGSIVSLSSSDIIRAQETKKIFVDTILDLGRYTHSGVAILRRFKRNGTELTDTELRRKTKDASLRYIIIDELDDQDLGYRRDENDNIVAFNEAMEVFNDEELVSYIWSATPEEWPELVMYLYDKQLEKISNQLGRNLSFTESQWLMMTIIEKSDPRKFLKRTPEDIVAIQLEAIEKQVSRALRVYPDRRNIIHITHHAPGCDFLAMALFGQDMTFNNYQELSGYRNYLEGMAFDVDTDGNVIVVDFRSKRSSIEPIKLSDVITGLHDKAEKRREAWKAFDQSSAYASLYLSIALGRSGSFGLLSKAA